MVKKREKMGHFDLAVSTPLGNHDKVKKKNNKRAQMVKITRKPNQTLINGHTNIQIYGQN